MRNKFLIFDWYFLGVALIEYVQIIQYCWYQHKNIEQQQDERSSLLWSKFDAHPVSGWKVTLW